MCIRTIIIIIELVLYSNRVGGLRRDNDDELRLRESKEIILYQMIILRLHQIN